jgi:hypothetical protein
VTQRSINVFIKRLSLALIPKKVNLVYKLESNIILQSASMPSICVCVFKIIFPLQFFRCFIHISPLSLSYLIIILNLDSTLILRLKNCRYSVPHLHNSLFSLVTSSLVSPHTFMFSVMFFFKVPDNYAHRSEWKTNLYTHEINTRHKITVFLYFSPQVFEKRKKYWEVNVGKHLPNFSHNIKCKLIQKREVKI